MQEYAQVISRRVQAVQEQARQAEHQYRRQLEREYQAQPVHDGARNHVPATYRWGQFVMVRRRRLEQFGVHSRGPFVVAEDRGDLVALQDLNTGRVLIEAKTNLKLLSLGTEMAD